MPPQDVQVRYAGPIGSRDIAEGGRIYLTLCAACHAGRVNPSGYHWSPAQMRQQIREGNYLMPPLDHRLLSDAQVEAVLAYLRVMEAIDGELPPAEPEREPERENLALVSPGGADDSDPEPSRDTPQPPAAASEPGPASLAPWERERGDVLDRPD